MKLGILCAALVLPLVSGGAWAEQAQRAASADPIDSTAYTESGWRRYNAQQYPEAAGDFEKAISLNPTNASACFGLGHCHYQLGNYPLAADSFQQYVTLQPNPEGYYWLGVSWSKQLNFRRAATEFRTAIDLDSTKPDFYDGLGYCLLQLGRYNQAIAAYKEAAARGGDNAQRSLNLGFCYSRTRRYSQAREAYRKYISLGAHNFDAYFGLGNALYNLGAYEAAGEAFQKAIQIKPDDSTAHLWLGESYYQLKSYQQAADAYRDAIECAPRNFDACCSLGDALLRLRRFAQAADAYGKAIRIEPGDPDAHYWRGYALIAALRFAEAVPDLEHAYQSNKEDQRTRYVLFCAYLMTSQFKKASELYPVGFGVGVGGLLISFGLGAALLLKKSFRASSIESPGLAFTIGWILICFEGQLVCTFFAGLFGLTFASGSVIAGMVAAPIPLLIAALAAFPNQTWGAPFSLPRSLPWKTVGVACLILIFISAGSDGYAKLMAGITHKPLPGPRNIPFFSEMIMGHPALAVLAGVMLLPMAEEVLFRGLLFGALRKRLGAGSTILTTAVVFAASHADLYYFVPLIAIGTVFGWVRNKTGSVWISAAVHILNNALAFAAF